MPVLDWCNDDPENPKPKTDAEAIAILEAEWPAVDERSIAATGRPMTCCRMFVDGELRLYQRRDGEIVACGPAPDWV